MLGHPEYSRATTARLVVKADSPVSQQPLQQCLQLTVVLLLDPTVSLSFTQHVNHV